MINLSFVTTLISLAFIFFIFSTMASMVYEYFSKLLKRRSTFLALSLSKILKDEFVNGVDFSLLLYEHPLITSMKQDEDTYPSYIPARTFAIALIEVVIHNAIGYTFNNQESGGDIAVNEDLPGAGTSVYHDTLDNFKNAVDKLANSNVKTLLATFLVNAKNHDDLQRNIELWYDEYMERSSGWYKKMTGRKMFRIAVAITLFFNIDTIHIVKALQENAALDARIAQAGQQYANANKDTKYDSVSFQQARDLMALSDSIGVPIGYNFHNTKQPKERQQAMHNMMSSLTEQSQHDGGWILLILGWLISATAISRGAPFWFDILTRIVNIRSSGNKPKSSKQDD